MTTPGATTTIPPARAGDADRAVYLGDEGGVGAGDQVDAGIVCDAGEGRTDGSRQAVRSDDPLFDLHPAVDDGAVGAGQRGEPEEIDGAAGGSAD